MRFSRTIIPLILVLAATACARLPGTKVSEEGPAMSGISTNGQKISIDVEDDGSPVMDHVASLLERVIRERCPEVRIARGARQGGSALLRVCLTIDPALGGESFRVSIDDPNTLRISGGDSRGVLYGVGRLLREGAFDGGVFRPGTWQGVSSPVKPVRGIYFATHFHNFYHEAPVADIQRYVEELALWGFNTLAVWYDMHHFNGFDDPAAEAFRERLRAILGAARSLGLDVALVMVANEGYGNSPVPLRADVSGMRGAMMETDICVSAEGGSEYVLENFARNFEAFRDLQPRYIWIWPYDSGGCGCDKCSPWGFAGYPRIARKVARLAREKLQGVQVLLSTWFLTPEEWQGLEADLGDASDWADYNIVEMILGGDAGALLRRGTPGKLPALGFPEISMEGMKPWGGFGATPRPRALERQWRDRADLLEGGFPYSEGIYEDLNKALFASFYWDPERSASETVREYVRYEFGPQVEGRVVELIAILEDNHLRNAIGESAERGWQIAQEVDRLIPPWARDGWRWRILYLRALIDWEMHAAGGAMRGKAIARAFEELTEIYYAHSALDEWLRPPVVSVE